MHSVARHRTAPQGKARRFASRNLRRLPLLSPSNLSPTRRVPHALNKSCCGRESNLGLPSTADEGLGMPGSTHDCGKICFCLSQRLVHAKLEQDSTGGREMGKSVSRRQVLTVDSLFVPVEARLVLPNGTSVVCPCLVRRRTLLQPGVYYML